MKKVSSLLAALMLLVAALGFTATAATAGGCTDNCPPAERIPVELGPQINALYSNVESTCDLPDNDPKIARQKRLYTRDASRLARLMSPTVYVFDFDKQRLHQCTEGQGLG